MQVSGAYALVQAHINGLVVFLYQQQALTDFAIVGMGIVLCGIYFAVRYRIIKSLNH
jgi:hypothetical protein